MRYLGLVLFAAALPAVAAVPTPPRDLTDPRSLNSLANPNAAPVPIADLFYTHSNGGIAWSPDGKEVVISSNLSGRLNLWKASAKGSWPVQLAHSDNRQIGAAWSPDGEWIVFQSDAAGRFIYANRSNAASSDSSVWRIDVDFREGRGTDTAPRGCIGAIDRGVRHGEIAGIDVESERRYSQSGCISCCDNLRTARTKTYCGR